MKHDNDNTEKTTKFKKYMDDVKRKSAVPFEAKPKDGVSDSKDALGALCGFGEHVNNTRSRYTDEVQHQANREFNRMVIESIGGLDDAVDASIDFEVSKMQERASAMHKHLGFDDAHSIATKFYGLHEKHLQVLLFNVVYECQRISRLSDDAGSKLLVNNTVKVVNESLRTITENTKELDQMAVRKALTVLRKAKSSGSLNAVISAISGCMAVLLNTTTSGDLNVAKLTLDGDDNA